MNFSVSVCVCFNVNFAGSETAVFVNAFLSFCFVICTKVLCRIKIILQIFISVANIKMLLFKLSRE